MAGIAQWFSVRRERLLPRVLRAPGRDAAERRYLLERTLHDDVAMVLAALVLKLAVVAEPVGDPRGSAEHDAARDTLCQLIAELRRIGAAIYPPALAGGGLGPALRSVAEQRGVLLRLDLPRHELGAEARSRTGLLVIDHIHRLGPGTSVSVRVRGRRLVRVCVIERRTGGSGRRRHRAVLRCA